MPVFSKETDEKMLAQIKVIRERFGEDFFKRICPNLEGLYHQILEEKKR